MNENDTRTAYRNFIPPKPQCRRPLRRMEQQNVRRQSIDKSQENINYSNPEFSMDENSEDKNNSETENWLKNRVTNSENLSQTFSRDFKYECKSSDNSSDTNDSNSDEICTKRSDNVRNRGKSNSNMNMTSQKSFPRNIAATNSYRFCIQCIVATITVVTLVYVIRSANSSTIKSDEMTEIINERLANFSHDLQDIKKIFPSQDSRIWNDIEAGVYEVIINPGKPSIFLLFSNEIRGLSCLAELLGKKVSKALNSQESLVLKPRDFGDNYGEAIANLEPQIKAKKVVVVHDLLNIHSGAIQAFHVFCDRESPLVKQAVYILTMTVHDSNNKYPISFIENILLNRFSTHIDEEKRQPLVTRLMDGPVIFIQPEISGTPCPI